MSRAYKFHNHAGIYFITFAIIGWIDVFTRKEYKDIFIESLIYCQKEKGLEIFCWCIMSNHIHLIARAKEGFELAGIIRDLKKFTSKKLFKAIDEHPQESRREWMVSIFRRAGEYNVNNKNFQFWRQDNKPMELFTKEVFDQKLNYIHTNPVKAGIVEYPHEYLYSSARDYVDRKGLVDVIIMI